MNLNTVISHLRDHCPSFAGRVAGAARFKMLDETSTLPVPAAYVIPLGDNPGEGMFLNSVRLPLVESFTVVVALDNKLDERGQNAVEVAVDLIREELFMALRGWQPDGLGHASRYRGIEYQGGELFGVDRSRLWFSFDFGAYTEIGPERSWQNTELGNLPHFDGLTINVDDIDPAADQNLQYPGPDGRIEHTITSPKTGNLP